MRAHLGYDREYTNAQMGTSMTKSVAQGAQVEIPEWVKQNNRDWRNAIQLDAILTDIESFITPKGPAMLQHNVLMSYDIESDANAMTINEPAYSYQVRSFTSRDGEAMRVAEVYHDKSESVVALFINVERDGFMESDIEPEPMSKYEMMRHFLTTNSPREPKNRIRIVGNVSNNNGRRCSMSGDRDKGYSRPWIIKCTMRGTVNHERYYTIRHMVTGETRIVWDRMLGNLY